MVNNYCISRGYDYDDVMSKDENETCINHSQWISLKGPTQRNGIVITCDKICHQTEISLWNIIKYYVFTVEWFNSCIVSSCKTIYFGYFISLFCEMYGNCFYGCGFNMNSQNRLQLLLGIAFFHY